MNTNSRCKRNTARKYQKNRIRIAFKLRQPQISLKHLDVSDLSCQPWGTTPLAPRAMMFGGHCRLYPRVTPKE
jgi:hypothetical protein